MDNRLRYLDATDSRLIFEVIARRNTALHDRVTRGDSVSRDDADEIVTVLGDELLDNLDDHWEPTAYGLAVSAAQARFNFARISQWPD